MAVVNRCLKGIFIGFNSLLEVVAILMSLGGVTGLIAGRANSVPGQEFVFVEVLIIAFGICTVASLGIWGINREKKWPLIVYITTHTIAVAILLIRTVKLVYVFYVMRSKIGSSMESEEFASAIHWTMSSVIGVCSGFLVLAAINLALAAALLRQLNMHQRQHISDVSTSGSYEPPRYSELNLLSTEDKANTWGYPL